MVTSVSHQRPWLLLALFLLISLLVFGFGGLFQPGDWYQTINKAPWTPPNLVFPIAWFFLYIFIAIAGWQLFLQRNQTLKWLWAVQLIFNASWSWVFFGQHWITLGLIDLLLIDALVATLIWKCWQAKLRTTAYLLCPYLAWLALATSLNVFIVVYN